MSRLIRVVRLEHPESGLGPFNHLHDYDAEALARFCGVFGHYTHKAPARDPHLAATFLQLDENEREAFAFACWTKRDLIAWFGARAVRWLRARGFVAYAFTVPPGHVFAGKRHLAFRRRNARRGRRVSLPA